MSEHGFHAEFCKHPMLGVGWWLLGPPGGFATPQDAVRRMDEYEQQIKELSDILATRYEEVGQHAATVACLEAEIAAAREQAKALYEVLEQIDDRDSIPWPEYVKKWWPNVQGTPASVSAGQIARAALATYQSGEPYKCLTCEALVEELAMKVCPWHHWPLNAVGTHHLVDGFPNPCQALNNAVLAAYREANP